MGRVVVFVYNISKEKKAARKAIDYDNADVSTIINCLTLLTLPNDSPYCYDLFQCYNEIPGEEEAGTDIYILSKVEFEKFMLEKGYLQLNGNEK